MATAETDPLNLLGTTISEKYRVDEVVGEGGFSVVYRAEHLIWQQAVALKCFKVSQLMDEEMRQGLLDAFIQEGKLMADLSSRTSAIVQARDVGTVSRDDGSWIPYMVLEWLEGEPLDKIMDEDLSAGAEGRSVEDCVGILNGAAEALALAHRRNVVHRDIKPANLFLVSSGNGDDVVKVLDFGVAKVMSEHLEADKALKQTSQLVTAFTPTYGAPEQFSRTHGATGPWTDVFAFALVIIELMQGGKPALAGEDFLRLAYASADTSKRPTPRSFGLMVSDEVEGVFLRALAVEPGERYPTMGDFWRALRVAVFPHERQWTPPDSLSLRASRPDRSQPPEAATLQFVKTEAVSSQPPTQDGQERSTTGPMETSTTPSKRAWTGPLIGVALGVAILAGFFLVMYPPWARDTQASAPPIASPPVVSASAAPRPPCPAAMAQVPGGKFFMGSDEEKFPLWKPAHKVELSPYCIDTREVSVADYKACSDVGECKRARTKSRWPKGKHGSKADHEKKQEVYSSLCNFGRKGFENHPVNCVSWEDASNYCKVHKKRLPTEAEWEYATRGSDGRAFPWGDEKPDHQHMNACGLECNAWEKEQGLPAGPRMYDQDDGYPGTAPVGSFPLGKTQFGLLDMVGNVFEWTADWFGPYDKAEAKDPRGPTNGDKRVIRGGAFNGGYVLWVNPAFRFGMGPEARTHGIGFRCAKAVESK